jgi:hypothetical protein
MRDYHKSAHMLCPQFILSFCNLIHFVHAGQNRVENKTEWQECQPMNHDLATVTTTHEQKAAQ